MSNHLKFIRFDLYASKDINAENFGGHVYLRAGDITAVTDPTAVVELPENARPMTHVCCAGETYTVRHNVAQVLQTISQLLDPQPSDTPPAQ
jgi:hypothetical protein